MIDAASALKAGDLSMSIREIIATERDHPGLIDDIILHIWQMQVIEEQMQAEKK